MAQAKSATRRARSPRARTRSTGTRTKTTRAKTSRAKTPRAKTTRPKTRTRPMRAKTARAKTTRARRTAGARQMDVIALLKHDHREVEQMFRRFAGLGLRAGKTRQELAHKIVRELAMHTAIEEQLLYPRIRMEVPGGPPMVKGALQGHQDAKELLVRIDRMSSGDEGFDEEMRALMKDVRHHVKEEEGEIFPKMRKAMRGEELVRLGEAMKAAKVIAPTHAHPHLPSTPPANIVTGLAAAVADRIRDLGRQVVNR